MTMQPTNRARVAVAVVALALATGACSPEKIGQSLAENAIEKACRDQGQSCDVDIDSGAMRIDTAEGSMTVDEDGNVVMVGADGQVVNIDNRGDGNLTVTDGDGATVVDQDGDTMTISGPDGSATFTTGSGVPAEFPSGIDLPAGAAVTASSVIPDTGGTSVALTLTAPGDLAGVSASATEGVAAAGYTETMKTETADGNWYMYEGNGQVVALTTAPDPASGRITVAYMITPQG
ncbi:MAG TPA: hypothetical protein VNQ73_09070 [Ilumatobacter sp.]|nr:hypothetical protein [Ilumatobacter sp.]